MEGALDVLPTGNSLNSGPGVIVSHIIGIALDHLERLEIRILHGLETVSSGHSNSRLESSNYRIRSRQIARAFANLVKFVALIEVQVQRTVIARFASAQIFRIEVRLPTCVLAQVGI